MEASPSTGEPSGLLPTPCAADDSPGQAVADRRARGHGAYLNDVDDLLSGDEWDEDADDEGDLDGGRLLPTPTAFDARELEHHPRTTANFDTGRGVLLSQQLAHDALLDLPGDDEPDPDDLLPTPTTMDQNEGLVDHPRRGGNGKRGPLLVQRAHDVDRGMTAPGTYLLPTITASAGEERNRVVYRRVYKGREWDCNLENALAPVSGADAGEVIVSGGTEEERSALPPLEKPGDGQPIRWGRFAAAVERWETLMGRPAPAPTQPGPSGKPELSPLFVEWMMGLPEGHVTDPRIWENMVDGRGRALTGRKAEKAARGAMLKALGNGVHPWQAAAATAAFVHDSGDLIELDVAVQAGDVADDGEPGGDVTGGPLLPTPVVSDLKQSARDTRPERRPGFSQLRDVRHLIEGES